MCDRIQHYERMMRYIQHRERVLNMKSVVKAQIERSRSAPPRKNLQKLAENKRRLDLDDERVMQSLMNIATPSSRSRISRRSETPSTTGRRSSNRSSEPKRLG